MKHLDLFSGIGGFALAARRVGWETVAFCEIDPYCQRVLAKHWPGVPIHSDVRELTGDAVGPVDIITGGYPCQPFSVAGKRGGAGDDRHLWPEFARLIRELRPRWAVGENVYGHVGMGLDEVLSDMEGLGYTWEAFVIPACAVDAPHRRDRLWIVGHADDEGEPDVSVNAEVAELPPLADRQRSRLEGHAGDGDGRNESGRQHQKKSRSAPAGGIPNRFQWPAEPDVGRVATRVSIGLDDCRGRLDDFARALARAKGVPEDDAYIGCLRALREYGEFTEAPSQLRRPGSVRDSLQIVSRQVAQRRAAGEPYEAMRDLWDEVSAAALEEAQDMLKTVLVGAWKAQCDEALGKRVHRLRALGNAVVPQVVEAIFRAIQEIENVRGERTCSAPRVESGHKNAAGYQRR